MSLRIKLHTIIIGYYTRAYHLVLAAMTMLWCCALWPANIKKKKYHTRRHRKSTLEVIWYFGRPLENDKTHCAAFAARLWFLYDREHRRQWGPVACDRARALGPCRSSYYVDLSDAGERSSSPAESASNAKQRQTRTRRQLLRRIVARSSRVNKQVSLSLASVDPLSSGNCFSRVVSDLPTT